MTSTSSGSPLASILKTNTLRARWTSLAFAHFVFVFSHLPLYHAHNSARRSTKPFSSIFLFVNSLRSGPASGDGCWWGCTLPWIWKTNTFLSRPRGLFAPSFQSSATPTTSSPRSWSKNLLTFPSVSNSMTSCNVSQNFIRPRSAPGLIRMSTCSSRRTERKISIQKKCLSFSLSNQSHLCPID